MNPEDIVEKFVQLGGDGSRRIIAIDGRGGAGKSTLARSLVDLLPDSKHIEYDWFHLPRAEVSPERRFDNTRARSELIEPFKQGQHEIAFRRYNWGFLAGKEDGYHEELEIVKDCKTLVMEGCGLLNRSLGNCFDFSVWVNTDPAESLRRGIHRDIEEYKLDPAKVHPLWKEWSTWEANTLKEDPRWERADLIY